MAVSFRRLVGEVVGAAGVAGGTRQQQARAPAVVGMAAELEDLA
jgi:hypothetical protein